MNRVLSSLALAAALSLVLPTGRALAEVTLNTTEPAAGTVTPQRITQLIQTMQIDDMLSIMRQEGLDYGNTLDEDMFGGSAGPEWAHAVDAIYDADTLRQRIEGAMLREYAQDPSTLADTEAFFGSDQGQKIVSLEVEARRTLLDKAAKDAAELSVQTMTAEDDPRMDLLRRFAETNDLLEMNVAGAMTSNLAFYKGLAAEGAFDEELTEDQMLSDVWSQEADVRAESEKWLYSFLSLAYAPLSDAELEAYIAYSETPAGKRLNAVLFAAFDEAFRQISFDLGRAAAKQMQGSDI